MCDLKSGRLLTEGGASLLRAGTTPHSPVSRELPRSLAQPLGAKTTLLGASSRE